MPSDRIGASLILDHADLEADLVELIRAFQIGDWPIARATYTGFERRLTNHFKREEQLLFEAFAREFPKETDELLAEHRLIRRRMDELGFGVDVHQTRLAAIEDLAALLRKHAAREDRLLYRWLDAHQPPTFDTQSLLGHRRSPAPPERS